MTLIRIFANMVKVSTGDAPPTPPPPKRGVVDGFSRKSRKRLLDRMNSIRHFDDALFVTLTYPDNFPPHPETWKNHLACLRKRMYRRWPKCGGVWRMEFETRKSGRNAGAVAPHFHMIVKGCGGPMNSIRNWFAAAWFDIVKSGDVKHKLAGTSASRCESRKHATWYVAKYMGKVDQNPYYDRVTGAKVPTGRVWGTFGDLDMEPYIDVKVQRIRYPLIRSMLANAVRPASPKFADRLREEEYGFTVYGVGWETDDRAMLLKLIQFCKGDMQWTDEKGT